MSKCAKCGKEIGEELLDDMDRYRLEDAFYELEQVDTRGLPNSIQRRIAEATRESEQALQEIYDEQDRVIGEHYDKSHRSSGEWVCLKCPEEFNG